MGPGYCLAMLEDLIEQVSRQVAAEEVFADLVESAFLAGVIDSQTQELAYLWILCNPQRVH